MDVIFFWNFSCYFFLIVLKYHEVGHQNVMIRKCQVRLEFFFRGGGLFSKRKQNSLLEKVKSILIADFNGKEVKLT